MGMVRPRLSIARVMLVVLFAAVDAARLRLTYRQVAIPPCDMGTSLLAPSLRFFLLLALQRIESADGNDWQFGHHLLVARPEDSSE
jgi:hypothetical protein